MQRKAVFLISATLIFLSLSAVAQESSQVTKLLNEVDLWVSSDTGKIVNYIDSTSKVTTEMLEKSPYWEPTVRDLSFLLGIDYIMSPQIDNTGRIYFLMRITGESEALFYVDKPMGWPIQVTPNSWAEEGYSISYYAVHPSGDYILVGVQQFGDEMHDIWYFSRDGKFKPLLVNRQIRYGAPIFDEDNPDQFYTYIDDRKTINFGRYTISRNKLDTLYTEPGAVYPLDYRKGKLLFARFISFSKSQLAILDLAGKAVTDLTDTTLVTAAAFTNEGQVLALTSAKSGENEFTKFCLINPAKPKEYRVIFDPKMETDEFAFIRKMGVAIAALNKDGYSEIAAFATDGNVIPMPKPEIGVVANISGNDIGDFVYGFNSPIVPPTAFKAKIGDVKTDQIGRIATFGFDFNNIKVDVVRYKSTDGTMIPSLLYVPKDATRFGGNPAIINYHGGPPSQSRPVFQRNIAFALSKGFIVMFPNVRGSTGYGPAWERADNLEGRYKALKDAESAIDYLVAEKWSSPKKIAIWGGSYGGYTVDWLATQVPDKFACAVSEVGVSDVDYTNRHSSQVFAKGWEQEFGPVGSTLTHKLSPIFYADQVTKPILLTGGYNDPRVPPSDPRRFAYVLARLGKPVWYYESREEGHGGSFKSQVIHELASSYVFTMMNIMQ